MAVLQLTVPLSWETRVRLKLFKLVCVAPWFPFRKHVGCWVEWDYATCGLVRVLD